MQVLTSLDLVKNELQNPKLHSLSTAPTSPVVGQMYFNTTSNRAFICTNATGPVWSELTVNYDMASNRLTSVADPTQPQDAATKAYVDAIRQGLVFKDPVRLATDAALPTCTYAAGVLTASANAALTVDGTAVAVNDRILVKNQTDGKQNGLYTVTQTGSGVAVWKLTRATDADGASEVVPGTFVLCTDGTVNQDTAFVCSNTGTVTIDTTSITWTVFGSILSIQAGNGLTQSGSVLNVVGTANRLTVGADSIDVNTSLLPSPVAGDLNKALVASGANTAAWTTIVRKYATTITGNGSTTSWPITHNLNTWDVQVMLYDASGTSARNQVLCDVQVTSVNACTLTVSPAIANAAVWTVVVVG